MKKILSLFISLTFVFAVPVWAQENFVVQQIQFEGLQRISPKTVKNYLPIKPGQRLNSTKTSEILQSLYKTGFFDDVSLARRNNVLIVHVVERPTIGQLKISGNSIIPTDKLTKVMTSVDIAEGRVYNPIMLDKIKQSLLSQYYLLGRYNAQVDIKTSKMSRNRVAVNLVISEGLVAKVERITIIGNSVFSEKTLIKQLDLQTAGLFTFISQADKYSEEKLETSIEKLRNYYLDRGYLRFEIKSAQAQVTPDRKAVYVTFVISEGQPFTIQSYSIEGDLLLPKEEVQKQILIKRGEIFSKQKIIDSEKAITKAYGEKGYMFAAVGLKPQVDTNTRKVTLVFEVKPGKRTYVRHINFIDNNKTNDKVLRREIQQLEAAPASTTKLEDSKHRLSLLPYIKTVDMSVQPVPDSNDEVDVNYKVLEDNSAQANLKIGYSRQYNLIFGAGFNQKNVFGTGNTLGINFQRSKFEQYYGIDFTDPYYTESGISRSINLSVSRTDPGNIGIRTGYTTHDYNAGVLFGIPLGSEEGVFNRLQLGVNYQNTLLNLAPDPNNSVQPISQQLNDFVTRHGTHFQQLDFKIGLTRDSRDKAIMPTKGMVQTFVVDAYVPLTKKSLTYYTLNYAARLYVPLTDDFIFLTKANLGYGNGLHGIHDFPLYKNNFSGGIDSVRGYEGFSLGPKDSRGIPMGGNILTNASVGIIFPNYISETLRTSVFVDAGNVYTSLNNRAYGFYSSDSGPLRYSTGIEVDWFSSFGPIELSLAKTLNKRPGDRGDAFQFALGANF